MSVLIVLYFLRYFLSLLKLDNDNDTLSTK